MANVLKRNFIFLKQRFGYWVLRIWAPAPELPNVRSTKSASPPPRTACRVSSPITVAPSLRPAPPNAAHFWKLPVVQRVLHKKREERLLDPQFPKARSFAAIDSENIKRRAEFQRSAGSEPQCPRRCRTSPPFPSHLLIDERRPSQGSCRSH